MLRTAAATIAWVGRTASMVFGLALVMALLFGVASTALGANGGSFILGKATNAATKVTGLVGKVATGQALVVKNPSGGSALGLSVGDPVADPATKAVAPMKVDSQAKVANLNADQVDGLSSEQLRGAYAAVDSDGGFNFFPTFLGWRTSGFASVTLEQNGLFCLEPSSGVQVRDRGVAVSVDATTTSAASGNGAAMFAGNCGTNGIRIRTERQAVSNGVLTTTLNNSIGFTVVVVP